jgi:hypothetical protein
MSFTDVDILQKSALVTKKIITKVTSKATWSSDSRSMVVSHSGNISGALSAQNKGIVRRLESLLVSGDSSFIFVGSKTGYLNPQVKAMLPGKRDSFILETRNTMCNWDVKDSALLPYLKDLNKLIM